MALSFINRIVFVFILFIIQNKSSAQLTAGAKASACISTSVGIQFSQTIIPDDLIKNSFKQQTFPNVDVNENINKSTKTF